MEPNQEDAGRPLPPKIDLKKQAVPTESAGGGDTKARFQTMEISLPDLEHASAPTSPVKLSPGPATTAARPVTSKRETSRIPYDSAKSVALAQGGVEASGPTTIRIKPAMGKATVDLKPFPVSEPLSPAAAAGMDEDIIKRKTSRISLDSATSQEDASESDDAPRTIRLKRPGEPAAGGAPRSLSADTAAVSMEGGDSGTRKKTVKLRRPGADGVPSAAEAAPAMDVVRAPAMPKTDSIHWTFGVFAVAAMLVAAVSVYVLLAQLTGANLCLTQLSVFWPSADLPWVNKLPMIP